LEIAGTGNIDKINNIHAMVKINTLVFHFGYRD